MQAHARTGPVAVADLEKMLAKVPWVLGEVSLYPEWLLGRISSPAVSALDGRR